MPLTHKYPVTAATGHRGDETLPTIKSTPFRNGSVFDCLMVICRIVGCCALSTATSSTLKCIFGSNVVSLGTVISPTRRKAKKQRHDAAHSIFVSCWPPVLSHTAFNLYRMSGVMGSRGLSPLPVSASCFFIPRVIYSSLAMGLPAKGSGRASSICRCRTADK